MGSPIIWLECDVVSDGSLKERSGMHVRSHTRYASNNESREDDSALNRQICLQDSIKVI